MKLKYNFNGATNEIPLTTKKPAGKRLAVRHNGQNYYAALVETSDTSASNLRTVFNGVEFAIQQQALPQITDLTITPPTLAAMQGQSATATISAIPNEQVTGLSYSLDNPPTWITISDDVILIEPSDNDLGQAVVQVYARDTGSDASASAPFVAEALLRPIIESLYVLPPAVTIQQGQSATAGISAVANAAVTGLSFSISGQSSWVNLNGDVIEMNPTDNDLGDNTVNVVAYDVNSSASAATQFVASAALRPIINAVTANPTDVTVNQGYSATVTLSADANAAVAGLSYSLANAPTWMTLGGDVITIAPTDNDLGSVTVTATAHDTGSTVEASTTFTATAEECTDYLNGLTISPSNASAINTYTSYAYLEPDTNIPQERLSYTFAASGDLTVTSSGNTATLRKSSYGKATYQATVTDSSGRFSASADASVHSFQQLTMMYKGDSWTINTTKSSIQSVTPSQRFYADYGRKWPSTLQYIPGTLQGALPNNATITSSTANYSDDTTATGVSFTIRYYPKQQTAYSGGKIINVTVQPSDTLRCVGNFTLMGAQGVDTITTLSIYNQG